MIAVEELPCDLDNGSTMGRNQLEYFNDNGNHKTLETENTI